MPAWEVSFDLRVDVMAQDIVQMVARSEALASVIHGLPLTPRTREKIDALNIMRAVRGTTGIEGTEISEDEAAEIIATPADHRVLPPSRARDEMEARNAEQVMRFVAKAIQEEPGLPLTEALIRQIHRLVTEGIDYLDNIPGKYRSHPVRAGTYVPPRSGEDVERLMAEFIRWFNEGPPRAWPAPVRAILAHFYVVSIHPFGDGNGRTARAVESLLLYQGGINALGFYSLSNFYYHHRSEEYPSMLDYCRFESGNDLTPFVRFSLNGLISELLDLHETVLSEMSVIAFRDYAREELIRAGKSATTSGDRMYQFLLGLADSPASVSQLRQGGHPLSHLYGHVTGKTLSRDLKFLRDRGLIVVQGDVVRANLEVMRQFIG
jgi:Fic family protein